MLRTRVITAVILAPLVLALIVYAPSAWFAVAMGVIGVLSAGEWARLSGVAGRRAEALNGLIVALACIALWFLPALQLPLLIAAVVWWGAAVIAVISFPARTHWWDSPHLLLPSGLLVLTATWLGLVQLQHDARGPLVLLQLLFMVWSADIGAYFAGRAFGRHKLAPAVSPGKTWQGAAGGALLAVLIGSAMAYWTVIGVGASMVMMALACLGIAAVSVLGDLTESMLKRQRGMKDSGSLLPGHGGLLDRIDSLLSTAPLWALWSLSSSG